MRGERESVRKGGGGVAAAELVTLPNPRKANYE